MELKSFVCPITRAVMIDPVVAMDGHSYERAAIAEWLREHLTSPATNQLLPSTLLLPNHALKQAIDEARSRSPMPERSTLEDLPDYGDRIYRVLEPIHACSSPVFTHRAKHSDGSPYIVPTGALVIVTCRLYGQDNCVFLRLEDGKLLYEARNGIPMAEPANPTPGVRLHQVLEDTPIFACISPTSNSTAEVLPRGTLVSTDWHVHDLQGGSFARLEGTRRWVSTTDLLRRFPVDGRTHLVMQQATSLQTNANNHFGGALCTVPADQSVNSTMTFPGKAPSTYLVRCSFQGSTGWLSASEGDFATTPLRTTSTANEVSTTLPERTTGAAETGQTHSRPEKALH
ncbi:hypothetical protein ACHHYP_05546 [Achlya hypogyna]|uniref:U-box domain-containing protein n=1 Tax=Achlya hypogyna TaxID=1202772 RepID=A0A1V9ZP89_ACHHY|nr:hypothetical protein ACHHYP_05546 [Achlya hypogyna]